MITKTEVCVTIKELFAAEWEEKPENIQTEDRLDNSGNEGKIFLIMALEEEFDIAISDEDAEKIITVNDAVNYIDEKLNPAFIKLYPDETVTAASWERVKVI